mmetsp:Transcript_41628/g.48053  ORF Transcript_41628/g.48053 Transcript_41628/m.48053 type:complete len:133 (-) Transcript_41628:197-595(-)
MNSLGEYEEYHQETTERDEAAPSSVPSSHINSSSYSSASKNMVKKVRNREESKELTETSDSEQQVYLRRGSDSFVAPKKNSSSVMSSSKESVGFLKDFNRIVELIKYKSLEKLRDELMKADDDIYGPIDMAK